jgi:hypothetical protein
MTLDQLPPAPLLFSDAHGNERHDPPSPPPVELMESQISLKHLNDVPNSPVSSATNAPLEERVAELEFKLATLSRLLQQSQRGGMNGSTVSSSHSTYS